jgi:heptosyltransferase III
VFEGNPFVDAIIPPAFQSLRAEKPDLCLNFHGGTRSAWMTAASGARYRVGFGHFRHRFVYNLRIPRAQQILDVERKVHTAEHLATAMFWLGVPRMEIPRAKLVSAKSAKPEPTAVIHPVAATAQKTWPAAGFIAVAEHLRAQGIEPVFIGTPTDDLRAFSDYRRQTGALSELKSLLASASIFVGNDSGPAHMAAAFGLPTIVIFSDSDPEIWAPWRTQSEVLIRPATETVLAALARLRVPA